LGEAKLEKILTPEEEREIAEKMLGLNGGYDPDVGRLLAASAKKNQHLG
jgi:hypothetical protein